MVLYEPLAIEEWWTGGEGMAPDWGLLFFANLEASLGYADCFSGECLAGRLPVGAVSLRWPSSPPCGCYLSLAFVFEVVPFRWKLALVGETCAIRTAPWIPSRSFSFRSSCCQTVACLLADGPLSAKRLAATRPSRRKSLLALKVGLTMAACIVLAGLCRGSLFAWRPSAL